MPGRIAADKPVPLTAPEDWQREGYGRPALRPEADFQTLLDRHLPKRPDWTALEVGACPGSQLLAIALSHGYHPVALDFLPAVRDLPGAFAGFGVPDLEVIEADFLTFATTRRFNVVMSFGFIEHFTEPEAIVRKQWELVAEDGYLVLGSPSFGPLQMALRRLTFKPEDLDRTLRIHNQAIMDAAAISEICRRLPGARIEVAAYAGRMGTWIKPRSSGVRRNRAWLIVLWHAAALVPRLLNWSSRLFSPLCLVIVRRTQAP